MKQNVVIALLAVCATLLGVLVLAPARSPFPEALGQAVGNTGSNYILATGVTQSGNQNVLFVYDTTTKKLAAYSVQRQGIEYLGMRNITWDLMPPLDLIPKGKSPRPGEVKKLIEEGGLGGDPKE